MGSSALRRPQLLYFGECPTGWAFNARVEFVFPPRVGPRARLAKLDTSHDKIVFQKRSKECVCPLLSCFLGHGGIAREREKEINFVGCLFQPTSLYFVNCYLDGQLVIALLTAQMARITIVSIESYVFPGRQTLSIVIQIVAARDDHQSRTTRPFGDGLRVSPLPRTHV